MTIDPKAPIDLPGPYCQHGTDISRDCPRCRRYERIDRLVLRLIPVVVVMVAAATMAAVWLSR